MKHDTSGVGIGIGNGVTENRTGESGNSSQLRSSLSSNECGDTELTHLLWTVNAALTGRLVQSIPLNAAKQIPKKYIRENISAPFRACLLQELVVTSRRVEGKVDDLESRTYRLRGGT